MRLTTLRRSLLLSVLLTAACSRSETESSLPTSDVPESFHLASAQPGAKTVREVITSAQDGDAVTVTGRVGGAKKVFVDGYAAFTIVDPSLKPCGVGSMDECKTPWDYCCVPPETIAANAVSVELVSDGKPLKASPRGFHGLDLLATVVVQGRVAKDASGNVRVLATGIHVTP